MKIFKDRLTSTSPMMHDPASLAATGAVLSSFFSASVIGSVTVGQIALTAALSGASFLLQSSAGSSSTLDPGVKETQQASIYEERIIYGRALVGGRIFFKECKPPYLYLGVEIASHEIAAIEKTFVNGKEVTFNGAGAAISSNFVNGSTSYLTISQRLGATGQTIDPILDADFSELPSTFCQQGHTCVVIKCYYGTGSDDHNKYWGSGMPQVMFQVRGMKVFDPRDPTQIQGDASTYKWSENPSLCMAHYITYSKGMAKAWADIDVDYLKAAANDDDSGVSLASGKVEKRYTCNGVFSANEVPANALLNMLTSNLGDCIWSNGKYRFYSAVPRTPCWTLTDNSARGDMDVRVTRDRASLINTVRTVFAAPDRDYQTVNGPILSNATYIAADGESHEITLSLPFTSSQTMSQRIAKATMEKSRKGKTVARRESIEAIMLEAADVINIDVAQLPSLGGIFKLNKLLLDHETMEVEIAGEEYDPAWLDWSVSDEQPFTISPAVLAGTN